MDDKEKTIGEYKGGSNSINYVDIGGQDAVTVSSPLRPLVDDKSGYIVLGRSGSSHRKWRRKGTLEIGVVGEHQDIGEDLFGRRVLLDAAFPHIVFICGKRGSGKSYTLGILAEELVKTSIGVGIVLIDPIGIFWSLKQENMSKREKNLLKKWVFSSHSFPEVKVLQPGGIEGLDSETTDGPYEIGVGEMDVEDWCELFDVDRFKTQGLLIGNALSKVKKGYSAMIEGKVEEMDGLGDRYSIADIIQCIQSSVSLTSKDGGFTPQTRRSVVARFAAADGWGIFSVEGTPLREVTSPNRITVIDISDPKLGDAKRRLITGILARKILSARIHSARLENRGIEDENDPELIPVTWLMIDEAHVILPHGKQTPATKALVEYAKQGRRPGCALVLATQRPAATSDEILSQVDLLLGHNLALEDDMNSLRRRVPAKLPPGFVHSDFIRAIPVGTAIMADQKTQQRSFLIKLRPRFSHHAGNSAMPMAMSDIPQKKSSVPMTGSYGSEETTDEEKDKAHHGTPSEKGKEDERTGSTSLSSEKGMEKSNVIEGINWGSTVLLKNGNRSLVEKMLSEISEDADISLFSRIHPSNFPLPPGVVTTNSYWLSSTPGDDTISPTNLQDIAMEAGRIMKGTEGRIVIFDGMEYLYMNNESGTVQKLIESLHEKVFLGKHILMVRVEESLKQEVLDKLLLEMDTVIDLEDRYGPEGPVKKERGESLSVEDIPESSLAKDDLIRMCSILDISTKGDYDDLMKRIIDYEGVVKGEVGETDVSHDWSWFEEVMKQASLFKEENKRLEEKISKLEKELSGKKRKKKIHGKKTEEREEEGKDLSSDSVDEEEVGKEGIQSYLDEIKQLKYDLEKKIRNTSKGRSNSIDGSVADAIWELKKQREEEMDRLTDLEEKLNRELYRLKGEIEELESEGFSTKKGKKLDRPLKGESRKGIKKNKKPKKKVLKEGQSKVVIPPKITPKKAVESAKRTIRKSLLRGPRERVDSVVPIYIPVYRCRVSFKSGLMKNRKEGDVFIDGIIGEVLAHSWGDLKRSVGITRLKKLTDLELKIFRILKTRSRDPSWVANKIGRSKSVAKRSLISMEKKGVVQRVTMEGGVEEFMISSDIDVPQKPWASDSGLHPILADGVKERFLEARIVESELPDIFGILSLRGELLQYDMVGYPMYSVMIKGEGRERRVAVNGISGKIDPEITHVLFNVRDEGESDRE